MRATGNKVRLFEALLLMTLPCRATVTLPVNSQMSCPERPVVSSHVDDATVMRESLRRDVVLHPGDFIVFATKAGVRRFFAEHNDEVERETDPRIVSRGVLGYWQGKTIVVLPLAALATQF
jgi:hypothetical protein